MEPTQHEINLKLFQAITCIQDALHSVKTMLSHQPEREVPEIISKLESLDQHVSELSIALKADEFRNPTM
ncbi:MAG: hypothetical protein ACM3S2_14270 [Ignavibacteriales bacterium]